MVQDKAKDEDMHPVHKIIRFKAVNKEYKAFIQESQQYVRESEEEKKKGGGVCRHKSRQQQYQRECKKYRHNNKYNILERINKVINNYSSHNTDVSKYPQ